MSHSKSLGKLLNFSGIQKFYFGKMASVPFPFCCCCFCFHVLMMQGPFATGVLNRVWKKCRKNKESIFLKILYGALELTLMLRIFKSMFFFHLEMREPNFRTDPSFALDLCFQKQNQYQGCFLLESQAALFPQRALLKIFNLSFKNVT